MLPIQPVECRPHALKVLKKEKRNKTGILDTAANPFPTDLFSPTQKASKPPGSASTIH